MAIVLCTGVQPALMQTRKLILEAAGHIVITAQSDSEIAAACRDYELDVAVIGQSTDGRLKRDWFSLICSLCPSIKIVEVYTINAGIALPDADECLESPVVPMQLAERVSLLAAAKKKKG